MMKGTQILFFPSPPLCATQSFKFRSLATLQTKPDVIVNTSRQPKPLRELS